mgnify:CR=1 FL=1
MAKEVPDRANHPKRKLVNMVATPHRGHMTGEPSIHVVDISDNNDRGRYYMGYSKLEARRRHKEHLEGN